MNHIEGQKRISKRRRTTINKYRIFAVRVFTYVHSSCVIAASTNPPSLPSSYFVYYTWEGALAGLHGSLLSCSIQFSGVQQQGKEERKMLRLTVSVGSAKKKVFECEKWNGKKTMKVVRRCTKHYSFPNIHALNPRGENIEWKQR